MSARRRTLVGAGVTVALLVGGGAVVLTQTAGARGTTEAEPAASAPERSTVEVVRQDLVVTQDVAGTLEFAEARELAVPRAGTVTWLPEVGTVVERGDALLRVDDEPVPLFLGDTPLYRELDGGALRGPDVDVVAENLIALGHLDVFPPGDVTGPRFVGGVRAWRDANDLGPVPVEPGPGAGGPESEDGEDAEDGEDTEAAATRTDVIRPGDALVLPGPVRVSAALVQLGAPADAGPVLRVTSTRRVVRVQAEGVGAATFTAGAPVTVALPDGTEVAGTVTSVGSSAESGDPEVLVDLPDQSALEGVDSGPVTVRVEVERRDQVLAVPVAALLALAEGGHALQLADGTLVAVETGLFTADTVEVSGEGVHEGMSVVTAR